VLYKCDMMMMMMTMTHSLYVTGSGTLSNELGNEPSQEIASFCIFPISHTADEGTCSFTVLLMLVSRQQCFRLVTVTD